MLEEKQVVASFMRQGESNANDNALPNSHIPKMALLKVQESDRPFKAVLRYKRYSARGRARDTPGYPVSVHGSGHG